MIGVHSQTLLDDILVTLWGDVLHDLEHVALLLLAEGLGVPGDTVVGWQNFIDLGKRRLSSELELGLILVYCASDSELVAVSQQDIRLK